MTRYTYIGEKPCISCRAPLQAGERFDGAEPVAVRPIGDTIVPVDNCEHCGEGQPLRREAS